MSLTAWGTCVPNQPASTTTSSLAVHLHYGINITGSLIYLTHIIGLFLPLFQFETSRSSTRFSSVYGRLYCVYEGNVHPIAYHECTKGV